MKNKLNYFIARFNCFGIGFYYLTKLAKQDAWITLILGTLIGIIILYFYGLIKKKLNNQSLKEFLLNKKLGFIYITLFIIFNIYLILILLTLLSLFTSAFYLVNTPQIIINLGFIILAILLTFKGKYVLENISNLLYVFSLIFIFTFLILLLKYLDFNNLTPILVIKPTNIIKASLIYASLTAIPQFITVDYNIDTKKLIKSYLVSSLTLFIILTAIILGLGNLGEIYSFPEYIVLKQIKLFNFIENVENVSCFVWYMDIFITLSTISINIFEYLPKKYNKLTLIISVIITTLFTNYYICNNYENIIILFLSSPLILSIFLILFLTLLFYKKDIKKSS